MIEQDRQKNPWRKLNAREVYRNPWMGVIEEKVIRPDGTPGIYAYMDCFPAVGIIPIIEEKQTCLVGQYRYPIDQYSWEIPTGMGTSEETTEETAKRELREETGLIVAEVTLLGHFHTSNSLTNEVATLYFGHVTEKGQAQLDATEQIETRIVSLQSAFGMIDNGGITDGMSIVALNWLRRRYDRL
jgi:ADP-ribose pyrophosphatase